MNNDDYKTMPDAAPGGKLPEHMVIKTGKHTYRFTSDWTDNEALSSLLAGLVADDLTGDEKE